MDRGNRLANDKSWPYAATACDDGQEHRWQPLSFVFETQLLDHDGRVIVRQPDLTDGRVYCVCMVCRSHTYVVTEFAGFYLGDPPSREAVGTDGGTQEADEGSPRA